MPFPADRPDPGLRLVEQVFGADEASWREVKELLVDPVTHLPTLHLLLKRIEFTLRDQRQVGVLSLHVSPFVKLEELFGWDMFDDVLRTIAELLLVLKRECLREADLLAELSMSGNSFVIVLSPPRHNRFVRYEDLDRLRERIHAALQSKLLESFSPELCCQFGAYIGCVVLNYDPDLPIGRLILRGLDSAYTDAFQEREEDLRERKAMVSQIIAERLIHTVYQPIVDLQAGTLLGYEACTRGPKGEFAKPDHLFRMAYQTNLLWQLERICRQDAVARLPELAPGRKLFVNVDPESISDPELSRWSASAPLANRLVLEITERAGIRDYVMFRRVLHAIREMGLGFAIDDLGSAYSGLRLIAEVQPDFIKLDMNITRNVDSVRLKRELVGTIARFAETVGSPLIVEGVETHEEFATLRDIGIRYAQGFLFGTPETEFTQVDLQQVLSAR